MPVRQVRPKKSTRSIATALETTGLSPAKRKAVSKLQEKTNQLIDEIDTVITGSAETLKNYRQQGGE